MNKSYSKIGTSVSRVAGMCRSDTRAPHDPPLEIVPTTYTSQGTLARLMPMELQTVTTSGTSTMGTVLAQKILTRKIPKSGHGKALTWKGIYRSIF